MKNIENRYQKECRMKKDKYPDILAGYARSIFKDIESHLRTDVHLVEDDIRLVLDEHNSSFTTYQILAGIYTSKDLSEVLLRILQPENERFHNAIDIEFDDITMKKKLVVRSGIIAIRADEKSFFSTILAFTPEWDYKHYDEYFSKKIVSLTTTNKIHLKCDVIDGPGVNGIRVSLLVSFF